MSPTLFFPGASLRLSTHVPLQPCTFRTIESNLSSSPSKVGDTRLGANWIIASTKVSWLSSRPTFISGLAGWHLDICGATPTKPLAAHNQELQRGFLSIHGYSQTMARDLWETYILAPTPRSLFDLGHAFVFREGHGSIASQYGQHFRNKFTSHALALAGDFQ